MSILLDALKKSEEQRTLGLTPTIHSNVEGQAHGDETLHRWVPVVMLALSAIIISWIGWQQYKPPSGAVSKAPQVVLTPAAREEGADLEQVSDQRTPVETFPAGQNRAAEVAAMPPQAGSQREQQPDDRREQLNQSFNSYQAEPVDAEIPGEARDLAAREDQTKTSGSEPQPGEPMAVKEQAEPQVPQPISYWELPQNVRDSLPAFKISVLVYAEQSGDRFLLINGQRLVENEDLEGGVRLDEIRRDGAVFLYRKYRFLVKG